MRSSLPALPLSRHTAVALVLTALAVWAAGSWASPPPASASSPAGGDSVPAPPHDVTVTGVPNGYRLEWINPSTQRDGSPLVDFGGIQVLRNGFAVAGIMRPQSAAGQPDSFVDVSPPPGSTWQLRAYDTENPRNLSELTATVFAPGPEPVILVTPAELQQFLPPGGFSNDLGLRIQNRGADPLNFSISEDIDWLLVAPDSATVPGFDFTRIRTRFDAAGLLPGEYSGSLRITSNDPETPVTEIPVQLVVGLPQLVVAPDPLEFTIALANQPHTILFVVSNPGTIPLSYTISSPAAWLGFNTVSGIVAPGGSAGHSLTARSTGLSPGVYHDSVLVVSDDPARPRLSIPARFDFLQSPPTIGVTPTPLLVEVRAGNTPPATKLRITNNGTERLNFNVSHNVPWLFVTPVQGSLNGSAATELNVSIIGADLPPGEHSGSIEVTSNDPATSALTVPVFLTVLPSLAEIQVQPDSLDLGDVLKGDIIYRQLGVLNTGASPLVVTVVESVPWLSITTIPNMVVPADGSADIVVRMSATGLQPGNHETLLTLTTNDVTRPTVVIPVRVRVVEPELEVNSPAVSFTTAWRGPAQTLPVSVSNLGLGTLHLDLTSSLPSWILVPPLIQVAPGAAGIVEVRVDPQSLTVGDHTATLVYDTNDSDEPQLEISVGLLVNSVPPSLSLTPEVLVLHAVENGPTIESALDVANPGFETLHFTVEENAPWLLVEPEGASLGPDGGVRLAVHAAPIGLPVGTHTTVLELHSNDPAGTDRSVPVTLNVRSWNGNTLAERLGVQEIGLACATGDTGVQFITLAAFGPGETYRPDIVLRAEDRFGMLIFEKRNLFGGAREGYPWAEGRTWLLTTSRFATVNSIFLDGLIPGGLDPLGGTITLFDGDPTAILHRFSYGPARGAPAPEPGQSLVRDENGVMVINFEPAPTNSHGVAATGIDCPCPLNALNVGGNRLETRAGSAVHPPPSSQNSGIANYSLPAGTLGAAGGSASVAVKDIYHALGAGSSDLAFDAVLRVRGYGGGYGDMYQGGSMSVSIQRGSSGPMEVQRSGSSFSYEGELVLPVRIKANETFLLTMTASASGELKGGYGGASGTLMFRGLPPGVTIRSCQGFENGSAPLPDPEVIENDGDFGVARVTWSVPGGRRLVTVERQDQSGEWTPYGIVEVDAESRASFEDRNVTAGLRYGYRLDLVDRFAGEIFIDVPIPPAFSLGAAYPNPTRGDLWVPISLPDNEPAILTLYDVAGREIVRQDIGAQGPGTVRINMTERRRLAAGIYLVKLTKRGEERSIKVVVIR